MKKIISLLLVSIMILSCMTMSVMALSSDNAAAYYSVIENLLLRDAVYYNSSSHLIDFDGDGIEELLILYGDFYDYDEMNYEVYSGEKLIAKDKFEVPITYPALYTEAVSALAKNEIMKGTSETELSPKGNCSVEQSIVLIYRTFLKIK